jgi:histone deacetylase complex regulatory component SIN3
MYPSEDATFDSDTLSDEARWQYYVASYTMTDATEGIDQAKLKRTYLRRNIAPQNANIEEAYDETFGNLDNVDTEKAFISPDDYKLVRENGFSMIRGTSKSEQKAYEPGKMVDSEKFRTKFVQNTPWMKDQNPEDVEQTKAAWEKNSKEGFSI